jgi:KUP system potassium uptake protein
VRHHLPTTRNLALALGALGIVYGDIGTSPLYALRECFHGPHAIALTAHNVFGVLSLIFWALTAVVTFKYLAFILRADNRGEGGVFALLALIPPKGRGLFAITVAALLGASMLLGDGIITPAISVLSAIEGLSVATGAARPFVIPLTILLLLGLFFVQRRGTGRIGAVFGPLMLVWFISLALLGLRGIALNPSVLAALSPHYAVRFFLENRIHGAVVLGSVVLVITGAEALYADLGHFGRNPIRASWFGLVLPSLLLNYFGQGALLLSAPGHASNPFYGLVPSLLLYPMVGLATAATAIASQALISGVFSVTRQAVQLGFLPRTRIVHTSGEMAGRIYVPTVNRFLMVACIALVLAFRDSSRLAAA